MRYLALICVVLLALIVVLQVRILSRLDDIARRPMPAASVVSYGTPVVSPNPSEIAAEVFKLMQRQGPPSFSFDNMGSSWMNDDNLQRADFRMKRTAGPAKDVSIITEPGVVAQITSIQQSDDNDLYQVTLKPKDSRFLPVPVPFSISYTDRDKKVQKRSFELLFDPHNPTPTAIKNF